MDVLGLTEMMSSYIIRPPRPQYNITELGTPPLTQAKPNSNSKILFTNELISLCLNQPITWPYSAPSIPTSSATISKGLR